MRLMLKTFWQLVRICLIAASLTVTGWTALASPEPWERRALDLPLGRLGWDDRQALREMRVLRLAVTVAPGLMVDMMAYSAPDIPRDVLERALDDAAHGRQIGGDAQPGRRISGAKFVRVE